eukprot:TRINITY_DN4134_c0_g1_i2.p1 TRINITY_DN4134_c0_g1~~TRINITY_DN4134_c0_g1_i2.p1  ORF type:complete len:324 (+),score=43.37 TRINITY_DN4134_c0_g1_i2:74-973(+)
MAMKVLRSMLAQLAVMLLIIGSTSAASSEVLGGIGGPPGAKVTNITKLPYQPPDGPGAKPQPAPVLQAKAHDGKKWLRDLDHLIKKIDHGLTPRDRRMRDGLLKKIDALYNRPLAHGILTAIFLGLAVSAALLYSRYRRWPEVETTPQGSQRPDFTNWSSGVFELEDDSTSCCSFCCTGLRWADTMEKLGFCYFWPSVIVFYMLLILSRTDMLPAFSLTFYFALALVLIFYRQRLRSTFGMKYGEPQTLCTDCLLVSGCPCCVVAQEARHVELAAKLNHEALQSKRPFSGVPAQQQEMP